MPPLRAKQGPRGWSVELGMDGMLEGCDGPPASSQASSLRACMRQLLIVQGILQSTTVQQGLATCLGSTLQEIKARGLCVLPCASVAAAGADHLTSSFRVIVTSICCTWAHEGMAVHGDRCLSC